MKKKYLPLILFFLALSCADVDLVPLDRPNEESFYNNFEEYDLITLSAYSPWNKLYQASSSALNVWSPVFKVLLAPSDNVQPTTWETQEATITGLQEYNDLNFDPSLRPLDRVYKFIYEGISRTNIVLERLPDGVQREVITQEQSNRLEAELRFLRAFYHFQAVKFWGNPPLITERIVDFESSVVGNSDEAEILDQIINDFQFAFDNLPTRDDWGQENLGRASKWAAMAYIGKVNVWKEDWNAAITAFEAVRTNGPFMLLSNYEDNFAADTENNAGTIFELQFGDNPGAVNIWVLEAQPGGQGNQPAVQHTMRLYWTHAHRDAFPGRQYNANGISFSFQSRGLYESTQEFADLFEPGDPRKTATVYSEGEDYVTRTGETFPYTLGEITDDNGFTYDYTQGVHIKKYLGTRGVTPEGVLDGRGHYNNDRFYRYSEMLLLYAEALIEVGRSGDAMNIINNEIRATIGMGPTSISDPTEAMRYEKRVELAFEAGQRFFDIQRWGIGPEVFGTQWQDRLNRFPYPSEEITRSGGALQQNPGY